MIKRLVCTLFTVVVIFLMRERDAGADDRTFVALRDNHIQRQEAVLGYLAGAAGVSLAGGAALLLWEPPIFRGQPKELRTSFAMMNLIYGVANTAFVIANFAGISSQPDTITNARLLGWDRARQGRALAMNTGLDMIYITLGFTLWATDTRSIVRGMGLGLALQGALLAGFDGAGAMLMTH
ncbi:MAG: hypothetical protein IPK82_03090 [Polyangiaceae bacterium]|nr:hypothetical protein [Polyangiaceae bacterium]